MLIQEHAVLGEISSVASRKPFSFVYDQSDSDSEFWYLRYFNPNF